MKEIFKKLNDFKSKVGAVRKDSTNPHFRNKYATIESVIETIEKPLLDANLGFYQSVKDMTLETVVYDVESGETLVSVVPLIMTKNDMQQLGSAITYARRYGLVSMFGLEQEDDDGNLASKPVQKQTPPVKNYTLDEVRSLAGVKEIDEAKICAGYKISSLEDANQGLLNTIYSALLKK